MLKYGFWEHCVSSKTKILKRVSIVYERKEVEVYINQIEACASAAHLLWRTHPK